MLAGEALIVGTSKDSISGFFQSPLAAAQEVTTFHWLDTGRLA